MARYLAVNAFTVRAIAFRQRRKFIRSAINKAIAVPVSGKLREYCEKLIWNNELRRMRTRKPKRDYVKSMSAVPHTDYDRWS